MSCLFLSFILLNPLRKKTAAYTWDMLHSWTGINIHDLAGPKINAPENGIYMNDNEHSKFGSFMFYFDKDKVSNTYLAKPYKSNIFPSIPILPTGKKCGWSKRPLGLRMERKLPMQRCQRIRSCRPHM